MHCTSQALIRGAFASALRSATPLPPSFLMPSIGKPIIQQTHSFSITPSSQARKDGNKSRSTSALHRTGHNKHQLFVPRSAARNTAEASLLYRRRTRRGNILVKDKIMANLPSRLPKPVLDPARRPAIETDPDHGLWDFFNESRDALMTPEELSSHGRSWSVPELRRKDWEDLHRLWWVCVKEKNRILTFRSERERVGDMYGDYEAEQRYKVVYRTMRSIRYVLTERWYTWENARSAAMDDPEIDLYADPEKGEEVWKQSEADDFEASEAEFEGDDKVARQPSAQTALPASDVGGAKELRV